MAKRSNIVLDDDILLFQILPRSPARSLGRLKCVCKQWHSFLTTPEFTKMHLHHVNNQSHHKQILVPAATSSCKYFRTIDCETPEVGLSSNRLFPFELGSNEILVISSLNGLVCIGIYPLSTSGCSFLDIILWNPLTGDYKTFKDNSHANCSKILTRATGFYYSSCDDDYKLLRVTQPGDAYIYSFKSESWRKIESSSCCLIRCWQLRCLLNENLYFLAQARNEMNPRSYSIIRFDTKAEKFTKIATPSTEGEVVSCIHLTVVSRCLHLCVVSKRVDLWDKLDLWKMEKDGEWTKVVSYCHKLCEFVACHAIHLVKNRNWLLVPIVGTYAFEVDLEMKTMKKVCTFSDDMRVFWRGKFVETIVSPNRYGG